MSFERNFFQYFENLNRRLRIQPLMLGGVATSGGGSGGPPGGFIGMLPQSRITYDKLEAATPTTPSGYTAPSGATLVDNLNHIRNRLEIIEVSGTLTVKQDGITIASGVTVMDFEGSTVTVQNDGGGKVTVVVSGSGGGISEVQDDGILVVTDATILNFEGGNQVTADGSTAKIESPIIYREEFFPLVLTSGYNTAKKFISNSVTVFYNGLRQSSQYINENGIRTGFTTDFTVRSGTHVLTEYEYYKSEN